MIDIAKIAKSIVAVIMMFNILGATAEAHLITNAQERARGLAYMRSIKAPVYKSKSWDYVFNDIVKSNRIPTEANKMGSARYLMGIYQTGENRLNMSSVAGGYAVATEQMTDFVFSESKERAGSPVVFHNHVNDNIASFGMAHEISHFLNEDYMNRVDREESKPARMNMLQDGTKTKLSDEFRADSKAVELVQNAVVGNVGGGLALFERHMQKFFVEDMTVNNNHPPMFERFARLEKELERLSSGRFKAVNQNGHLAVLLDGKVFHVPYHDNSREASTQIEHDLSVAGGIAKAMSKGAVDISVNTRMNGTEDTQYTVIIAVYPDKSYSMIDTYPVPSTRVFDFLDGAKNGHRNGDTEAMKAIARMNFYDSIIKGKN